MKLKNIRNNDKMFLRLFWSYVSVTAIPIILIGIITVGLLFGKLSSETQKLNISALEQFQNIIDMNFKSIMTVLYQIQESENVKTLFSAESLTREESVYNTWLVSNDIKMYHANNMILENIGVYYDKYRFIVDRGVNYTLREYYERYLLGSNYTYQMWEEKISGTDKRFFITATTQKELGIINTLLYCQTFSDIKDGRGMVVAVINLDEIMESIKSVAIDADWVLSISDRQGELVFRIGNSGILPNSDASDIDKGTVVTRKSKVIDLIYTYTFPGGNYSGTIAFINFIFILLILLGILFSIIAAAVSTKRMYIPFLKLSDERNTLLKELDKQLKVMRNKSLLNLLSGVVTENLDLDELEKKYGFKVDCKKICVITYGVPKTDETEAYFDLFSEYDFFEKIYYNITSALKDNHIHFETVFINRLHSVLIVYDYDDNQLKELCNQVIHYCEQKYSMNLIIGVGNEVDSILKLNQSYSGADLALRFGNSYQNGEIIYYNDIKQLETMKPYYTIEKEQFLIRYIKLGDKVRVAGVLNEIYRVNFCEMHLSHDALRWLIRQIALAIYKVISEINNESAEKLEKFNRVMRNISMNEDLKVCFEMLSEICYSLCVQEHGKDENREFKEKVLEYLNTNYSNSLLSLDTLAEYMDINYYTLSRLFKEYIGDTFVNYLTSIRLEQAKELLLHTTLSVKQVSEKTGFNDSSSFIRVFKKFCSITPAQFRKQQKGSK